MNKRILIATGIYPPKIGGPAQYSKNLKEQFEILGHKVVIKTFHLEDRLPTGIRHIYFFFKSLYAVLSSDMIFALDTYGVGFPTVFASKMFFRKCIIRTGGDFLWEQYCERHNKKILFRKFYSDEKDLFDLKEKIIFAVTRWTLQNAAHVIFSTDWQRQIFIKAYGINENKTSIVENYYGPKESDFDPENKEFIASTRKLVWKNLDTLQEIFSEVELDNYKVELFLGNLPYLELMKRMESCYATILVSLGDISPNMILDSIRLNRPFICTREVGIYERIQSAGAFIDPQNEKEIESAIRNILTPEGYARAREKVRNFNFTHTWEEIAEEFITTYNKL